MFYLSVVSELVDNDLDEDLLAVHVSVVDGRWVSGGAVGGSVVSGSVEDLSVCQWTAVNGLVEKLSVGRWTVVGGQRPVSGQWLCNTPNFQDTIYPLCPGSLESESPPIFSSLTNLQRPS